MIYLCVFINLGSTVGPRTASRLLVSAMPFVCNLEKQCQCGHIADCTLAMTTVSLGNYSLSEVYQIVYYQITRNLIILIIDVH